MTSTDDYLMLSGIQHFSFCKRQWALIHIEQLWEENQYTREGQNLHENTDDPYVKEKRKDLIVSRAVPIASSKLKLSGIIDTLEYRKDPNGIIIPNKDDLWLPNIVEYKRGKPKKDNRDIVQLVAQIICLEEKYNIKIDSSDIFYFQTRKREKVFISESLRQEVVLMSNEMHEIYNKKITPKAEYFKNCTLCSLYDVCMPRLSKKKRSVYNYLMRDDN